MKNFESEYRRERKRIQNYISSRKKLGFLSEFKLPKIPKRITEGSIRKLKQYTPKKLREYEKRWFSRETGEIFDSENHADLTKEYKKERRELIKTRKQQEKVKRDVEKDSVFYDNVNGNNQRSNDRYKIYKSNFIAMVEELPDRMQAVYAKMLAMLRQSYSDREIFEAMSKANNGEFFLAEDYYTNQQANNFMEEVSDILGAGLSMSEYQEVLFNEDIAEYDVANYV